VSQSSIVQKLSDEFKEELEHESQVVYILVEIGKMLEQDDAQTVYSTINFYRNWVVHAKLERHPLAVELLDLFDQYICSGQEVSERLKALLKSLTLRIELREYLRSHSLVAPFCEDDVKWKSFVKILARVILDVPLTVNDKTTIKKANKISKKTPTKYVESVTVERSRNQNGVAMLRWTANCHTPPPDDVQSWLDVVLFPGDDIVLTSDHERIGE
jgi:hypothetical protein